MSAAAAVRHNDSSLMSRPHMSGPLTFSAMFHIAVILLSILGLPFIRHNLPDMAEPMTVELATVAELTQTDKKPERAETSRRTPPDEKPVEKPPEREQMPTVTAKTPPKPVAPQRPDDVVMPKDKPEETVKEPEKAKEVKPPKPLKRPMLTQSAEESQEDFQSVLKNLMPATPQAAASPDAPESGEQPSPLARFSQQLSMSEADALRYQLSQCWNVMAGARYAEDIVVDIKLFVNPDRTVRDAHIVDQIRYMSDTTFRAAADGAMRAIKHPRCNPLELPPEKYEQWKEIVVTFDPRSML